ncbi:MAG TPA: hypothetical protein VFA65_03645 [Bryobacteraceae bacterium]|nr:hypothetical protein [Bryobacteraceae bacterium]
MPSKSRRAVLCARSLALFVLSVLFLTAFFGQLHKHNSPTQQDTCLICHVTNRANVAAIDTNAGKPPVTTGAICCNIQDKGRLLEFQPSSRVPRAPPSEFLS